MIIQWPFGLLVQLKPSFVFVFFLIQPTQFFGRENLDNWVSDNYQFAASFALKAKHEGITQTVLKNLKLKQTVERQKLFFDKLGQNFLRVTVSISKNSCQQLFVSSSYRVSNNRR